MIASLILSYEFSEGKGGNKHVSDFAKDLASQGSRKGEGLSVTPKTRLPPPPPRYAETRLISGVVLHDMCGTVGYDIV